MSTRQRDSIARMPGGQHAPASAERGCRTNCSKGASVPVALTFLAGLLLAASAAQADPTCGDWFSAALVQREYHVMAYDSARGVAVLFGGYNGDYLGDTWEWDGATWTQRYPATSPSARDYATMVYDSTRGVTVLFGGYYYDGTHHYFGDTWEWDGATWTQRNPAASPPARGRHTMAYDSTRGVIVLFGGYYYDTYSHYLGDTWEWDGTTWTQRFSANNPIGRASSSTAYDSARGVIVLFGGSNGGYFDDTWEWDGTAWTLGTPATHPSARGYQAMAYDSAHGVTLLFGGYYYDSTWHYLSDTWQWNGTTWTQRNLFSHPSGRLGHAMIYDSVHALIVLFAGYSYDTSAHLLSDTWQWNGTSWAQPCSPTSPPARSGHAMVFDSARGVTVLFGGGYLAGTWQYLNDTWEWDGTHWAQRTPASSPPARFYHAMAYDATRGMTVLFGGQSGSNLNDTWEWNGTTWAHRTPATSPAARYQHAMAYDSSRGVTVLFGGSSSGILSDTWEWNGTTWTNRNPAERPTYRYAHAMAYDSARGVTALFGGNNGFAELADTWEWDGTAWTHPTPATGPTARAWHAAAYDIARGTTVLFGGSNGDYGFFADTWEWNGTTWTQRSTATSPEARSCRGMAYDSNRGAVVLFGGYDGSLYRSDTWEISDPPLDGDLDGSGVADGLDIAPFVKAVLNGSTTPSDLCHADFDGDGTIGLGDLPGFIGRLLGS